MTKELTNSQLSVVSGQLERLKVINADVIEGLRRLPEKSVQCVVTSPPYWGLRSYLPKGHPLKHLEIGQEKTVDCGRRSVSPGGETAENGASRQQRPTLCGECYVCRMVAVFREVWRVLRDDGTVWLNLGDTYASAWSVASADGRPMGAGSLVNGKRKDRPNRLGGFLKEKDLVMVPFRVAMALQAEGWYVRSDIVWAKPNCMPESVTDRPTRSHEYIFLLTKSARYFYEAEAIKEPSIYDVDGTGTAARKARADEGDKGFPVGERAGMRPAGYKNSVNFEGKNKGNDKQRGHSRRHDGFNDRWDAKEKAILHHGQDDRRFEDGTFSNNKADRPVIGMRNKRDVWWVSPACYPEAHFATFPRKLIEPCILAGTSAAGCCARCGAPLGRKVEDGELRIEQQQACGGDQNGEYHGESTKDHAEHGVQDASAVKARVLAGMREKKTMGWEFACKCWIPQISRGSAEPKAASLPPQSIMPCVVLDRFGGSGTTGEVALELGRRAILIELNPEYVPLINRRVNSVTPGLPI